VASFAGQTAASEATSTSVQTSSTMTASVTQHAGSAVNGNNLELQVFGLILVAAGQLLP